MTDIRPAAALTRPERAPDAGPLDDRLYDLVEARFRRLIRDNPVYGTFVGLHEGDDRWGDGSRDALLGELAAERAHLAAVEALDPAGLSATARFERDLELHNVRRSDLRHRGRADLGAPLDRARPDRRRALPRAGPRLRAALRAPRGAHRTARGDPGLPGPASHPGGRAPGPPVAGHRAGDGRGPAVVLRRHRGRRSRGPRRGRAGPPPAGRRDPPRRRSTRTPSGCAARSRARSTTGRSVASGTTSSSALRAFDGPRRRRHPRARLRSSWPRTRPPASPPRVRSTRPRRGDGRRPHQVGPPGRPSTKRWRPTATPCSAPASTSSSTTSSRCPTASGSTSSRHPSYLRNVIPFAAYFDPPKFDNDPSGHLHRHAVGGRRPERDARAQLRLDQQHQHPRGVPGPPPPARGGDPPSRR